MKRTYIILIFILRLINCLMQTKEKEFFKIETKQNENIHFEISQNIEQKNFINIQIIICDSNSHNSYFSIENNNNIIFTTDLIFSRQLTINITNFKNKKLIINASSPKMYLQYQFINKELILFPYGIIKNYNNNIEEKSINFYLSPVLNNSETTYELYFTKNKLINKCEKLEFSLYHQPIAVSKIKGNNFFNLNFNYFVKGFGEGKVNGNIFIMGVNVDNFSYVYFYDTIEMTVYCEKEKENVINKDNKNEGNLFLIFLFLILCFIIFILYYLKKKGIFFKRKNDFVKIESTFQN